jgi:hypothetical protein
LQFGQRLRGSGISGNGRDGRGLAKHLRRKAYNAHPGPCSNHRAKDHAREQATA